MPRSPEWNHWPSKAASVAFDDVVASAAGTRKERKQGPQTARQVGGRAERKRLKRVRKGYLDHLQAWGGRGTGVDEVTHVAVGTGPGPFTGLRVGIVTAAGLADARGLPVVGVCSLDAVGSGARTVVTDARRKEVYWAAYDAAGARVEGPAVVRPEELRRPGPFVGDPTFAERLGAAVERAEVTTAGLLRAAAAQLADPSSAAPLVPLYLRRPDAVPPTAIKAVTQ